MTRSTSCPDLTRLKGLLDSSLPEPEQAQLIAHLDDCPGCQQSLEEMAAGGSSWPAAVRHVGRDRPPSGSAFWPALRQVEDELATRVDTPRDSATDDDISLDFLQPAEEPGSLGKLGNFDVVGVVGRGGMGLVLKAFDPCLQRDVALKVLDPKIAPNATARQRFCREARAAAQVTHENVVAIHQVEREEASDLPFLVMQLVGGESLQDRLDREGALKVRDVVRIGMQAAAGLAAAHARGLIHRDIKPANILLEEGTGRVKLTDFGLARAAEDVRLTQTGFLTGTPLYMSPEQARGEPVDHRSDLFSLGSVLYALCTGQAPFNGSTPYVVLKSVTEERPRSIREINPEDPGWLVEVIERLHAKDPADRFQSAAEVAELLARHLALFEEPTVVLPAGVRTATWVGVSDPHRTGRAWGRRQVLSVAVPLALLGGLALTETSGVTRLLPALVRPHAPEAGRPPRAVLRGTPAPVWSAAFSPDGGTVAMALDEGIVRLWDAAGSKAAGTLRGHEGPVWTVAFAPDGNAVATGGSDMTVKLWDPATGSERRSLRHRAPVRSLAFSRDGTRLVVGSRDGMVTVWDLGRGRERFAQRAHSGEVVSVAFSPDGTLVASASGDGTIKLSDAGTGKELETLKGHTGGVYCVAFSPDGQALASGGWDHTARLWDVATAAERAVFRGHSQDVWCVAFAPDGKRLATGSEDRTVKLWDVAAGREVETLKDHTGTVYAVAFAPDGRTLASGGRDGTLRLWDVATPGGAK
jgi:WD40 repeat protein